MSNDSTNNHWVDAPLGDLIDHILSVYHAPLREELQRLETLVRGVDQRNPSAGAQRRSGLAPTFRALRLALEQHMGKEEQILFPMIRQGMGAHATGPIAVMESEHTSATVGVRRLRSMTSSQEFLANTDPARCALHEGFEALDEALERHIGLENDNLFPRALAGGAPI